MKRALLATSLALSASAWAGGPIGEDKYLHAGGSAFLGALVAQAAPTLGAPTQVLIALVPGVAKELVDRTQPGNKFSSKDLVADLIGAAIGVYGHRWNVARQGNTTTVTYSTDF